MNTYTFTKVELEQFLLSIITSFAGEDGVYDFSRVEDNTRQMVVNRAIAALEASQPQRDTLLENSLPAIDEDEDISDATERELDDWLIEALNRDYHEDDNINPAKLGLPPVA